MRWSPTIVGTVGYLALGFTFLEALYQTVTTVATVGFREVRPQTSAGQIFTIVLIFLGVGTVLYSIGVILEAVTEVHLPEHLERRQAAMRYQQASSDRPARSAAMADLLVVAGYDAYSVAGGTAAWARSGRAGCHHRGGGAPPGWEVVPRCVVASRREQPLRNDEFRRRAATSGERSLAGRDHRQ